MENKFFKLQQNTSTKTTSSLKKIYEQQLILSKSGCLFWLNLLYANIPFLQHIFISYIFIIKNIFSYLKQFNLVFYVVKVFEKKIFFSSLFLQISDGKSMKNENFYRKFQQMILYSQIIFFSAIFVYFVQN